MSADKRDDGLPEGRLGEVRATRPSELLRRAYKRLDRRGGGLMRRGGRGTGTGGREESTALLLFALRDFSPVAYYTTDMGGGEAGAQPFAILSFFKLDSFTTGQRNIAQRINTAGAIGGWQQVFRATVNTIGASFRAANNAWIDAPQITFTQSDLGRLHCAISFLSATHARQLANRAEPQAGVTMPAAFVPWTGPMTIGGRDTTSSPGIALVGVLSLQGALTDAQLAAVFDAVRTLGDVPTSVEGVTIAHRWSARDTLRAVPSQRGRTTQGVRNFSAANYLQTALAAWGSTQGFAFEWIGVLGTGTATSGTRILANALINSPVEGFQLMTTGANASLIFRCIANVSGTPTVVDATAGILAQQLNHVHHVVGIYDADAKRLRLVVNGIHLGDVVFASPLVPAASVRLTLGYGGAIIQLPHEQASCMGASYSEGTITVAEAQAAFESYLQTGRVAGFGARTRDLWDFTLDMEAASGAVPAQFANRVTPARPLDRVGTLGPAVVVAAGAPPPAALEDTVTKATLDRATRVGGPRVEEIEGARDGQRMVGAAGFSADHYFSSPNGIRGATGVFYVEWTHRIEAQSTAVYRHPIAHGTKWDVRFVNNNTQIGFAVGAAGSGGYNLVASDVRRVMHCIAQYDAAGIAHLYVDGVEAGTPGPSGGAFTPGAGPFTIGKRSDGSPATDVTMFQVAGGDVALTPTEVQERFQHWRRTGELKRDAKTQHAWVLGADDGVPTVVQDLVGTDHLTRHGLSVRTLGAAKGVRDYAATAYYASPVGITGSASGHWMAVPFIPESQTAGLGGEFLAGKQNNPSNGGFQLTTDAPNNVLRYGSNSGGGFAYAPLGTISAQDLGVPQLAVIRHTGSTIELWYKGARVGGATAVSTFAASTNAFSIGLRVSDLAIPCRQNTLLGAAGGNQPITDAEIAQLFSDFATTPSRVPRVAGKTDRRWDIGLDIDDAGGKTPGRLLEREGSGDDLVRVGHPLLSSPRVERLFAWEKTPIVKGASITAGGGHGYVGAHRIDTTSLWVAFVYAMGNLNGNYPLRFQSTGTGAQNGGFEFVISSGTLLLFRAMNTSTYTPTGAPTQAVSAADLGKINVALGIVDTTNQRVRLMSKRVEAGNTNGTALPTGYSPPVPGTQLSLGGGLGVGATDLKVFGYCYGRGVPTLAQYQALWDEVMAADGRLVRGIQGMTDLLYDLHSEIPGEALPATLTDKMGSGATLSRAGSPTYHPQFTRAFAA